ncbi:holin [Parazoarcus communis]|uniref:Holin n=1 Tax=Parazoarcus communis TaxID=41977 RepID=A0A2U8GRZ3_9RHOO|nr:oligosaccharide flippase family protein [Parazoarcus communis]AWI75265.1 holin [Parazoarcus communis]
MEHHGRRIARNTLALYFRTLLTTVVALYTSRVILEALGVSDFGLFSLVGGLMVLMGFLNAAMTAATQRFLNFEKGRSGTSDDVQRVFATSLFIHLMLAVVILLIAETLGLWFLNTQLNIAPDRMDAANWVYQCALLAFLVNVVTAPFNAAIIANERMAAFAYVSIVDVGLRLAVAYALFRVSGDRLQVYAVLMLVVAALVAGVYGWYARRNFSECHTRPARDPRLFREILSFSSWSILSNLSVVLRLQGTNVILNLIFGTLVNAAFGLALQVSNALQSFTSSFIQALNPQIVKTYAAGDLAQMHTLVLKGARLAFFLVLLMVLPVLIEAEALLGIWLSTVPEHTVVFIQLVLIQALVESFAGVTGTAQAATGKVRTYHLTVSTIGMTNLPISYVFLSQGFAPEIVFVVAIVLSALIAVARLYFLRHSIALPMMLFARDVGLRCGAVLMLAPLAPLAVKYHAPETLFGIFLVCAVAGISVVAAVAVIGLHRDERRIVLDIFARRFGKPS